MQNKVLTPLNQIMQVGIYDLINPDGTAVAYSTINGLPLGTVGGTFEGELGVKCIIIGGDIEVANSAVPTHNLVFSYIGGTNNIDEIEYRTLGTDELVATTTFTYVNDGVADDDLIETMSTVLA